MKFFEELRECRSIVRLQPEQKTQGPLHVYNHRCIDGCRYGMQEALERKEIAA